MAFDAASATAGPLDRNSLPSSEIVTLWPRASQ